MCLRIKTLVILIALLSQSVGYAADPESILKAVLIEKFTRFIEWNDTLDNPGSKVDFTIGTICDDDFSEVLTEIYAEIPIQNRRVGVIQLQTKDQITSCDLVFFGRCICENCPSKRIVEFLNAALHKPILLIGEDHRLCEQGVHICLKKSGSRIRFDINAGAIRQSNLDVSYKLLRLADKVYMDEE